MAGIDQTRTFRFSGKLIASPTNLAIASPYGGTVLGAMRQARLTIGRTMARVGAEEFREPAEKIIGGTRALLRGFVRQWDKDHILKLFADSTTDADGKPLISSPGTVRAGALGSALATKILFAADDPVNNPSALLYNAIPEVLADGIDFSTIVEGAIYVEWEGLRDSSARVYQVGYLARMSL